MQARSRRARHSRDRTSHVLIVGGFLLMLAAAVLPYLLGL